MAELEPSVDRQSPAVSITIVLHNSARHLPACLRAIQPTVSTGWAELIAVDNASPDNSVEVVSAEVPTAQIIRSSTNRGFAGGANLAWPHTSGRYWLLLNPDVVLDRNGVAELVAWMDAHREVGIASPEMANSQGRAGSSGRAFPSIGLTLLEAFRLHKILPARMRARVLKGPYWLGGDQLDAGWVPGTAVIVRREAVETTGLLSEAFFMYGEDVEWCWRFRVMRWRVGVCSRVTARHYSGASANRTWGAEETRRRMVFGTRQAVRRTRGPLYARAYTLTVLGALWLEAHHPRRLPDARADSRAEFDAWRAVARLDRLPRP